MKKFVTALAIGLTGFVIAATATEVAIDQSGQQFSQKNITVKAGDSIKFTNSDDVTHNISVVGPEGDDDQGLQKPGESIVVAFSKPGDYSIYCHIHPKMKMKATVQ